MNETDAKMEDKTSKESCYKFEEITPEQTIPPCWTDRAISATYILHLEGNGRYEQVKSQIEQLRPTKTVWILHNRGFKECQKDANIKIPPQDIVDSYFTIFKHAQEHSYRNILVMEDDFVFDQERLRDTNKLRDVDEFLGTVADQDQDVMYHIGTLPIVQWPWTWDAKHNLIVISAGTHGAVYTPIYGKSTGIQHFRLGCIHDHTSGIPFLLLRTLCLSIVPKYRKF
jgi:hypothetical protein